MIFGASKMGFLILAVQLYMQDFLQMETCFCVVCMLIIIVTACSYSVKVCITRGGEPSF